MTAASARTLIPLGCTLSLLALSAAQPANASPILVEQSVTTPAAEFVMSPIETAEGWGHEEQSQPADAAYYLNLVAIGAAVEPVVSGDLGAIAGLVVNNPTKSSQASVQIDVNRDDYALEHNIAVSVYFGVYNLNEDVVNDLLTSYHAISRITNDVSTAINSSIGISNDNKVDSADATSSSLESNPACHGCDTSIAYFVNLIHFLLSSGAIPYYIIVASFYLIIKVVRLLLRN